MIRRVTIALCLACAVPAPLWALQPPAAGQEQWIPVDQLPPADQMPAAPLLIAAYAFVWIATMAYLWSIWRRLGRVEDELRALQRRGSSAGGPR
jgi:CcmD family protein